MLEPAVEPPLELHVVRVGLAMLDLCFALPEPPLHQQLLMTASAGSLHFDLWSAPFLAV